MIQHWLSAYSVHSYSCQASGRSKEGLGLGCLPTRSWYVTLDLKQGSQLEGLTRVNCAWCHWGPCSYMHPKRACSIRPLDKSEGSQIREARMGRVTLVWQQVKHSQQTPWPQGPVWIKDEMGEAHMARVKPESAGRNIRKDIRSGWTTAQR